MNWKRALVAVLVFVPVVAVLAFGFGRDPHAVPFALRDRPAPAFALPALRGDGTVSLADYRGRAVVLNFWASWCIPCAHEQPVLDWASREWADRAQFVGVVYQDTRERALAYLDEHGAAFPHAVDANSSVALDYGLAGVPETFFIDARGVIRDKHVGPLTPPDLVERLRRVTAAEARR